MKQIRERWRELDREEFRIELEAQNFADAIDVILYIEAVKRDLRPLIKARRYREASAVIREHPDIIDELRTYIITTK